jgi:predicted transcriptional regulator
MQEHPPDWHHRKRTGLDVIMDILQSVRDGPRKKYDVLWSCGLAYNNPRWKETIAKTLVLVERPSHGKPLVRLTEKGRRALELYEDLMKELSE